MYCVMRASVPSLYNICTNVIIMSLLCCYFLPSVTINHCTFPFTFLDIDHHVTEAKDILKYLGKQELKDLFRELGLYHSTISNKADSADLNEYADELICKWILEKDDVIQPTWENLKKALQKFKHFGIARNI